jgi:hypothetical protein
MNRGLIDTLLIVAFLAIRVLLYALGLALVLGGFAFLSWGAYRGGYLILYWGTMAMLVLYLLGRDAHERRKRDGNDGR